MKSTGEKNNKYKILIISAVIGLLSSAVFVFLFAALMYFFGLDKAYSVIMATASVAAGCFASAFYAAYSVKEKGLLIGALVGAVAFIAVLLISFVIDKGSVSINTLFHFIIFMLSALSGGVLGVNKAVNKKYIK